jgi:hypothetical protein
MVIQTGKPCNVSSEKMYQCTRYPVYRAAQNGNTNRENTVKLNFLVKKGKSCKSNREKMFTKQGKPCNVSSKKM